MVRLCVPHRWHVVFGQYVGFTALVLVSLVGFLGGQILPHEWLRLFGVAPIAIGIKKLFTKSNVHLKGASAGAIDVAIVTFVNGADNIGIYTPLFAVSDARRLIVLVAVLYVLLAAWCIVGYVIHRQKTVAYSLHGGALARALSSYRPWHLHPAKMRIQTESAAA